MDTEHFLAAMIMEDNLNRHTVTEWLERRGVPSKNLQKRVHQIVDREWQNDDLKDLELTATYIRFVTNASRAKGGIKSYSRQKEEMGEEKFAEKMSRVARAK